MTMVSTAIAVGPVRYLLKPGTAYATVCSCPAGNYGGKQNCSYCSGGCTTSDCAGGCCDGYTTFCCTINNGSNSCPPNSFIGGWWQCDSSSFCGSPGSSTGPRYYLDCNSTCSGTGCACSGPEQSLSCNGANAWCANQAGSYQCVSCSCHCPGGNCGSRATCCNWFRYGQCNTSHVCSGPVVCRVATCLTPWGHYGCSGSICRDNNTCTQSASCL